MPIAGSRLGPSLICALSLLAGGGLAVWADREISAQTARVTVDALIPAGTRFNFYYNESQQPESLAVAANQWHSYVFDIPAKVTALRLDPTEAVGTVALIRGIRFAKGNGRAVPLDLSALPAWSPYHASLTYDSVSRIASFHATGREPFVTSPVNVDLGSGAWSGWQLNPVTLLWVCLVAGSVYFLLQTWEAGWQIIAACLLLPSLAVPASRLALSAVPLLRLSPSPPDDAVGNPTFYNISKPAEIMTLAAGIAFSLAVIWLGIVLARWLRPRPLPSLDPTPVPLRRSDLGFLSALLATFAVLSFPDLQSLCSSLFHVNHGYGFDPQILTIWEDLAHRGFLPDRDYWFPYTGLYNKLAPLVPELLWNYFHNFLIFTVVAASTYVLFGRRKLATAITVLPLLPLLETAGVAWPDASWRYFLGVSVALSMAAALSVRASLPFIVVGTWAAYVLSQESAQLFYAVPAVLFLCVAALALERDRQARTRLIWLLGKAAAAFALFAAIWLAILASERRLAEWWNYMTGLETQAHYFAFPIDIRKWFERPDSVETLGYLLLLLLFLAASLQLFRCQGVIPPSHLAPFAVALAALMIMQKAALRPGVISQFSSVVLYGLLMVLVQYSPAAPDRPAVLPHALRLAWAAFACALLFVLFAVMPGTWGKVFARYSGRVFHMKENVAYAVDHRGEWNAAAAAFFAPKSLTMDDVSGDIAKAEFLQATAGQPGLVFALGDCAYWYLLLGQQPPFYFMFFHQAPLDAQENTLHWLQSHQPSYVLWDPSEAAFDGVPNPVRVPLLYTYIAANYVPATRVRNYRVLRRRAPGEPADLPFWRETLGSTVNLGFVPALSRLTAKSKERSGIPVTYLQVHVAKPTTGRPHQVELLLGSTTLTVSFEERNPVHDYPIRIDRLALVAAAAANGIVPQLTGADVSLHSGFLRSGLLY